MTVTCNIRNGPPESSPRPRYAWSLARHLGWTWRGNPNARSLRWSRRRHRLERRTHAAARHLGVTPPGILTPTGLYLPRAAFKAARGLCRAASAFRQRLRATWEGVQTLVTTLAARLGVGGPPPRPPRPLLDAPPRPAPPRIDPAKLAALAAGPVDFGALAALFA